MIKRTIMYGNKWGRGYSELKRYVEQEGKVPSQSTVTTTGYRLGVWVNAQRYKYNKGLLEEDRKKRLEAIPGWVWCAHEDNWEQMYTDLKRYVEQENRLPFINTVLPTGYHLGNWINNQRQMCKNGTLNRNRQERLEAIPYWSWYPLEEQWEQGYSELKRYVEQENRLPLTNTVSPTGYNLGNWINNQRQMCKNGILEGDKKELLEEIPYWSWDHHEELWERGYSELKKYVEQKRKVPSQNTVTTTGYRLGAWINRQRYRYSKGLLKEDRKKRLEAIPGWMWSFAKS